MHKYTAHSRAQVLIIVETHMLSVFQLNCISYLYELHNSMAKYYHLLLVPLI